MIALFKKEVRYFFTSVTGYITISIFILYNSLFLWVLPSEYNIFDSGFADLYPFFHLSSWILVFLIPALTMRTISEEKRTGMLSVLLTRPLTIWQIILGKYAGVLLLILMLLFSSSIYLYMVSELGNRYDSIEIGTITGSYLALFLLASTFACIGIWASAITQNQVTSFVLATFLNFFFFYGLDQIISLIFSDIFISFGFKHHFDDLSRGVIDTRNIGYFLSILFLFLYLTHVTLSSEKQ